MATSFPLLPNLTGLPGLGDPLSMSAQPTTQPDTQQNTFGDIISGIGRAVGGVTGSDVNTDALQNAAKFGGLGVGNITWGRVAAFVVGLAFIVGGLLLFRQTQVVISRAASLAA